MASNETTKNLQEIEERQAAGWEVPSRTDHWLSRLKNGVTRNILYLAWVQACIATFGSLYFSEAMDLTPCVLCWYQRILMYPLAIIIAVGVLRRDSGIYLYVLPLSMLGLVIASYHNLLYYGVLPESVQPCMLGVSCTTRQIEWLGFITIPLMSLAAFTTVTVCMLIHRTLNRGNYE